MKYLTLGMELELYDVREYCYYFWYMSEVILLWNTSSLFRAEKSLTEPSYLELKCELSSYFISCYDRYVDEICLVN